MERNYEMYCIETFTGSGTKTAPRAKIYATLHGLNISDKIPLGQSSTEKPSTFKRGGVDSFYLVIPEITNLSGITLCCETRAWELGQVVVKASGRTYKAEFNIIIDKADVFRPLTLIEDQTTPFLEGRILLGPMLKLRGNFEDFWCVSAMVVTENVPVMPAPLSFNVSSSGEFDSAPPVCYYAQNNNQMWRFDFQVRLADVEQVVTYRLPNWLERKEYAFLIPARSQKPGVLFCSCNDRAHPYNMSPNERVHKSVGWDYMQQQMSKDKYHLLLMGGDQVYCDTLFFACESVRIWDALPSKEKYSNSAAYPKRK